jgi:threonine dehydrogenase-like Zn-dependent dehydrogenase
VTVVGAVPGASPAGVPDRMRAAVYVGDGRLEVHELAVPEAGPGQVLVEVSHCGICGTDLHLVLERYARPGSVLGHEWSGTVAAVPAPAPGGEVSSWHPGQRVVVGPSPGCGRCRACRRHRPSVCLERPAPDYLDGNGAYCRYQVVSAARLLAVPEGLSLRHAALVEPTAIALHTVGLSGVVPGERVLITGAGPVGQLTLAVLRARGVDDVTVTDPSPLRRQRALELGASAAWSPDALVAAPTGATVDAPFEVAFECSGRADAAEAALDQLDFAGTLVFVGTGSTLPRVNHNRMIVLELTVLGAYNYDAAGFGPALELLASGALPLDLLVEPTDVPLAGLGGVMEQLAAGTLAAKVLVDPHLGPGAGGPVDGRPTEGAGATP